MELSRDDRPAIRFDRVSFSINGNRILHDLSLDIQRGETLVLLGRSGCGKTTTLKLINHLLAPTDGSVCVDGRLTHEWDLIRLRRMIGYVIQEVGLFPHFTVERNIGIVPTIENWPSERIHERVQELLKLVGLDPRVASRYPRELSGGQRQRVGVARALAADPPILLMDEPFGALDPLTRVELRTEFLGLQKRLCKTIVFVTHDLREALRFGTRIALMEAGRLVTARPRQEFLASTEASVVAYKNAFDGDLENLE